MATVNNNLSEYDKATIPNAKDFRFGIVVSEWNDKITNGLFQGAFDAFIDCGVLKENIVRWDVPGSFELIYGCKKMQESSQGVKDLNIQSDIPVIFCVLTDNNEQQSLDRSGGIHGNKGTEAAIAAIKMAELRKNAKF